MTATSHAPIHEYIISDAGDTILEFAKAASEGYPVIRFRVSSQFLLADTSSVFFYALSRLDNPPLSLANDLPPPPSRHTCEDGTKVNLYRMPQVEYNNHKALTILLHATHLRNSKVPEDISFQTFVSIAEVCLRYRLTTPLELHVEYRWLPQWLDKVGADDPEGMLLISYAFGLRRIFSRVTKTVIMNSITDEQIEDKIIWPQLIREKIKEARAVKFAQVYECCARAIQDYLGPRPTETSQLPRSFGGVALTNVPRCPRGSSVCDATNLGWLMLLYNELRILPRLVGHGGTFGSSDASRHNLRDLLDSLRRFPSVPQGHSGVCDSVFVFRSAVNDISNSIKGLQLYEMRRLYGWPLLKRTPRTGDEDGYNEVHEIWGSKSQKMSPETVALSNERINLRILSHMDSYDDLHTAAILNKTFYLAYKNNELKLLKNVIFAGKTKGKPGFDATLRRAEVNGTEASPANPITKISPFPGATDLVHDIESHIATLTLGTTRDAQVHAYDNDSTGLEILSNDRIDRNEKFLYNEIFCTQSKEKGAEGHKHLEEEYAREFHLRV